MTFSKRVGMEPASDLKKRICSLCEEAGFTVVSAFSSMHREETLEDSRRLILVYSHEPGWNPQVPDNYVGTPFDEHKMSQVEVRAFIGVDGAYDGMVQILCGAQRHVGDTFSPTLRDCHVPIAELPRWLPEVARQLRAVLDGRAKGENGPWQFGILRWESWS